MYVPDVLFVCLFFLEGGGGGWWGAGRVSFSFPTNFFCQFYNTFPSRKLYAIVA